MQIFLRFVNFYKRFIYCYFRTIASLTNLFKSNENEKKKNSFEWPNEVEQTFCQLKNIFISISLFIYYGFLKRNRTKIDIFNFAIVKIFSQQNKNDNWRSLTFSSRKTIFVEQNYLIYNQELLIIIAVFRQWEDYLENNFYSIKIMPNYNNLKKFITKKELNWRQPRWAQNFAVYDLEIFHRSNNKNFVNDSSRRFDYKKI